MPITLQDSTTIADVDTQLDHLDTLDDDLDVGRERFRLITLRRMLVDTTTPALAA